jgi:putative transposase
VILSQRIRLAPNNAQASFFERCAGASRFVYNWGLAQWQKLHAVGEKASWQKLNADLNARKAVEFSWLDEVPWRVANAALEDLGNAFSHFFRRVKLGKKPGYPRFKSKKRTAPSFCIEGRAILFAGKKIKLPKLGWVRTRQELRFPGKVLSARFTKRAGHWYASVQVEVDESRWVYHNRCETQAAVGVELGVVDLAVLSTGERIEAPRALRHYEKKLRRLNKELARRSKGGTNWQKTKAKLARLHERIASVRQDVTHKLTAMLVQRFRWIGIEDLHVKGMATNRHLAKSLMDAAMAEVGRQLAYKAPLAGSTLVVADRFYPSSKTCSACGVVYADLTLGQRTWTCDACGAEHDRDENAAKNLKLLAEAHAVTACCHVSSGSALKSGAKLPLGQESSNVANSD